VRAPIRVHDQIRRIFPKTKLAFGVLTFLTVIGLCDLLRAVPLEPSALFPQCVICKGAVRTGPPPK
jgi:hypothetical protein